MWEIKERQELFDLNLAGRYNSPVPSLVGFYLVDLNYPKFTIGPYCTKEDAENALEKMKEAAAKNLPFEG